ncbi:rhodanese domain phosphatase [Tritrichomonas foetus]|uniref:Rhodanese domain phosphatase n=1 Tax=Tritrichomonas foetus TaxID=1144522 RepID=A0A1J4J9M3_9EUKA|nr:rhodanese domain phosphatase [Tritrichomonas foetus]|eukprot:OHS94133.1 rhodanese domain phosphatase [Tritrichomonas foetus]
MLIDVRDVDYGEGGIIKGAINIQSMFFNEAIITDLINKAKEQDISYMILYCQFGQQRSVKFAKTVNNVLCQMNPIPLIQIGYVEGGFKAFYAAYHNSEYVVDAE